MSLAAARLGTHHRVDIDALAVPLCMGHQVRGGGHHVDPHHTQPTPPRDPVTNNNRAVTWIWLPIDDIAALEHHQEVKASFAVVVHPSRVRAGEDLEDEACLPSERFL